MDGSGVALIHTSLVAWKHLPSDLSLNGLFYYDAAHSGLLVSMDNWEVVNHLIQYNQKCYHKSHTSEIPRPVLFKFQNILSTLKGFCAQSKCGMTTCHVVILETSSATERCRSPVGQTLSYSIVSIRGFCAISEPDRISLLRCGKFSLI